MTQYRPSRISCTRYPLAAGIAGPLALSGIVVAFAAVLFSIESAATIAKEALSDEGAAVVVAVEIEVILLPASSADANAGCDNDDEDEDDNMLLNVEEARVGSSRSKDIAVIRATEQQTLLDS